MLSTNFETGSPNWLDLGSPDIPATAAFYSAVFGWTFKSAGPAAGGYGFFQKSGKTVAAIGPLMEEGATSAWTAYFQTPDADATATAVEQGGGAVRVAPMDVMGEGWMAAFTDPIGAEFAVWQPAGTKGFELASEPNTLCWVELHTTSPVGDLDFYKSLFKWRSQQMEVPGMSYTVISTASGDIQDASFGGAAPLQKGDSPRWIPYFDVTSVDETVAASQQAGGSVLMPAADIPEVGRMAWLADPNRAPFALLQPAPRAE